MSASWDFREHSPDSLWRQAAAELLAATASARHPLHLLTVATLNEAAEPDQRTVVLRHFDAAIPELAFHTDIRSGKARQLAACPRVSLHWYEPQARLQVRIVAAARIHHADARAAAAWADARVTSRACYTAAEPPGTPVESFPAAPPIPQADDRRGFDQFAVVVCRFTSLELLSLHATGHQRVRLLPTADPVAWQLLAP